MPSAAGPLSVPTHPRWSPDMRPVAVGFLPDLCTITRPGVGAGTLDRATGITSGPAVTTVATGRPCQVALVGQEPAIPLTGEQRVTLRQYDVKVDLGTAGVQAEDTLTVTAVGTQADPELVGVALRVLSVNHTSIAWTKILRCQYYEG